MDAMDSLQRQNIELQVELRMLRERLVEAQQGTQYLVTCLSKQNTQPCLQHLTSLNNDSSVLHELRTENAYLRNRLTRLERSYGKPSPQFRISTTKHLTKLGLTDHQDSYASSDSDQGNTTDQYTAPEDLLSFENTDLSTTTASLVLPEDTASTTKAGSTPSLGSSLGSSTSPLTPTTLFQKHGAPPELMHARDRSSLVVQTPYEADDDSFASPPTLVGLAQPKHAPSADDGWQAIRPPPSSVQPELIFTTPFTPWEHNRLSGMAIFIEGMSDDELESYWPNSATKDQRHSAEEWRSYYESVVRPQFLRKMRTREEAMASTLTPPCGAVSELEFVDAVSGGDGEGQASTHAVGNETTFLEQALDDGTEHLAASEPNVEDVCGEVAKETIIAPSTECSMLLNSPGMRPEQIVAPITPIETSIPDIEHSNGLGESLQHPTATPTSPNSLSVDSSLSPTKPTTSGGNQYVFHTGFIHRSPRTPPSDTRIAVSNPRRGPHSSFFPKRSSDLFYRYHSSEASLLRTVMISNIPTSISLSEVIANVRGGKIVSVTFLHVAGMVFKNTPPINTNSVMVVFMTSARAAAFVEFCQTNSIRFEVEDGTEMVKAKVELVQTPSRPLPPSLWFDMQENGHSRVLFIIDEHHQWTSQVVVRQLLSHDRDHLRPRPIFAERNENGVLYFEFSSVRDAEEARNIVDQDAAFFRGASKGFWSDPCDRPLRKRHDSGMGMVDQKGEGEGGEDGSSDDSESAVTVLYSPISAAQSVYQGF